MDIILLQKVANLGNIGDRVKVKSGFGRNYLLPQGKATVATPDNIKRFEARRAELEKAAREHFSSAEERATALKDFKLVIRPRREPRGSSSAPLARLTLRKRPRRPASRSSAAKFVFRTAPCGRLAITRSFCICTPTSMCRWQ